jgi:hypothetical protein
VSDFKLAGGRATRGTIPFTSTDTAGILMPDGRRMSLSNTVPLTAAEIATPTAAILADTTATYVSSGGARYTSNGTNLVGLSANWFTPVVDITRNSANDATDSTSTVLATFVVPPNVLRIGSIITVYAGFENTNSANTKIFQLFLNGVNVGAPTNTANQAFGFVIPVHVFDANTLVVQNNPSGTGASVGTYLTRTVTGVVNVGLTITLQCQWNAQPIAGEFIRLKFGKIVITP